MTGTPPLGRFPGIPADAMSAEQKALATAFLDRRGTIPGPYKIWISAPLFATRLKGLSDHLLRQGALSPRACEIAILVTARRLSAPFIEAAHRRLALDAGLPQAAIDAICSDRAPLLGDERERAVYEAALAMHAHRPPGDEAFDRAVAILGHDGLSELAGLIGLY
jgi:4-carboxymuconolactone decarboxylase